MQYVFGILGRYLQEAINHLKKQEQLNDELLKHISPLNWSHINFLGEYYFDDQDVPKGEQLRDLIL